MHARFAARLLASLGSLQSGHVISRPLRSIHCSHADLAQPWRTDKRCRCTLQPTDMRECPHAGETVRVLKPVPELLQMVTASSIGVRLSQPISF